MKYGTVNSFVEQNSHDDTENIEDRERRVGNEYDYDNGDVM